MAMKGPQRLQRMWKKRKDSGRDGDPPISQRTRPGEEEEDSHRAFLINTRWKVMWLLGGRVESKREGQPF